MAAHPLGEGAHTREERLARVGVAQRRALRRRCEGFVAAQQQCLRRIEPGAFEPGADQPGDRPASLVQFALLRDRGGPALYERGDAGEPALEGFKPAMNSDFAPKVA